jgi:hypothetical protein
VGADVLQHARASLQLLDHGLDLLLLRLEATLQGGRDFAEGENDLVAKLDARVENPRVALPVFGELNEVVKGLDARVEARHEGGGVLLLLLPGRLFNVGEVLRRVLEQHIENGAKRPPRHLAVALRLHILLDIVGVELWQQLCADFSDARQGIRALGHVAHEEARDCLALLDRAVAPRICAPHVPEGFII